MPGSLYTFPYFPTKPTRDTRLSCCVRYIASTSYQLRGLSVIQIRLLELCHNGAKVFVYSGN